jgi:hypothetical protein
MGIYSPCSVAAFGRNNGNLSQILIYSRSTAKALILCDKKGEFNFRTGQTAANRTQFGQNCHVSGGFSGKSGRKGFRMPKKKR